MRSIVLIFVVYFFWQVSAAAQETGCWNIFRGNQHLTGLSQVECPAQPKLLWTFETGDMIKSSPVVCSNKMVVTSTNGTVYCLSMDGKLLWKFETPNSIEASALILDNRVYVGNLDGTFYALDLGSGKKLWEYKTENQIIGSANWWKSGNSTFLLVGSYDYYLHCVDAATGKVKWKYESDNFINGAAAVHHGKAIFGGCDGFLHVVDIATGQADEKINVATYVAGSVALENRVAFVGDYDGCFSRVEIQDGKIAWKWKDEKVHLPFIASPALAGNRVVTASHDKNVYCFDKSSGKLLWSYNTGNRVEASPVVAGKQALVANMRGDLILLDLADG
ncbi:MAG TPA: PQQ-binding-like beta-propeller repeat protein, partial [Prolixibacteraceae bacterium]|nr:PQQ-binding-like beta-propeller repeat protein [Prolixibacteraceae bacterium]